MTRRLESNACALCVHPALLSAVRRWVCKTNFIKTTYGCHGTAFLAARPPLMPPALAARNMSVRMLEQGTMMCPSRPDVVM